MSEPWCEREENSLFDSYLRIHDLAVRECQRGALDHQAFRSILAGFSCALPGGLRALTTDLEAIAKARIGIRQMEAALIQRCPHCAVEIQGPKKP